ncbi:MAG: MotA/TolQ/ExbB proton channel family protein [Bacteroidota bacterium]
MFLSLLNDGGPLFMYTLLLILILVLILLVKGFLKKGNTEKTLSLIGSISLFAVVWGFLGQSLGLISAFDTIEEVGDISPAVLAGGLKISFLAPVFGLFIFLIGRLGIIILTWMQKD